MRCFNLKGWPSTIGNGPVAALSLLLMLATSGCGSNPLDTMAAVPPAATIYRLGPGDQIKITMFGEPALTGEIRVGDTGHIALPLAGDIKAAGRTPLELGGDVERVLKGSGLYRDPKITVEISSYRPVFVLGEVARPGQYPYQPGMTALTAVAVAGGFTYRAVTDRFSVVRDLPDGAVEGRVNRQTLLNPNDVLTVYERMF